MSGRASCCGGRGLALLFFSVLLVAYCRASSVLCNSPARFTNAQVAPGFCAVTWATKLATPRGLITLPNGDLMVIERGSSSITVLWDADKDGSSSKTERQTLVQLRGLNHGLAYDAQRNYLYASTSTTVYRWIYHHETRLLQRPERLVVSHIPCCHHTSRTLLLRPDGSLLVSVGSAANVDENDLHARIHLFTLEAMNAGTVEWNSGTVYARGMRNEVGIGYDPQGRVWGVENGVDDLKRDDLGPDLVYNNPGEEVNLFSENPSEFGKFYGYPYCWSENFLPPATAQGKGAQWAHPHFMHTGRPEGTDAWCKNPANVVKPSYLLPAHSAPISILFYNGTKFPSEYVGDAFVSLHGSWDRVDPVGYAVVRLHFQDGMPVRHSIFLANKPKRPRDSESEDNQEQKKTDDYPEPPLWNHRPTGLAIGPCGRGSECLFVASDATQVIMAIAFDS